MKTSNKLPVSDNLILEVIGETAVDYSQPLWPIIARAAQEEDLRLDFTQDVLEKPLFTKELRRGLQGRRECCFGSVQFDRRLPFQEGLRQANELVRLHPHLRQANPWDLFSMAAHFVDFLFEGIMIAGATYTNIRTVHKVIALTSTGLQAVHNFRRLCWQIVEEWLKSKKNYHFLFVWDKGVDPGIRFQFA